MARLRYFSWVREKIGTPHEEIPLPDTVTTVQTLVDHLRTLSPHHAAALENPAIRVAVNQSHARHHDPVCNADEIALFPPVSGG